MNLLCDIILAQTEVVVGYFDAGICRPVMLVTKGGFVLHKCAFVVRHALI